MSSIPRLQGNRDSGRRLASYLFLAGWTFLSDSERIALLMYGLSVFVYASGFKGDKLIADHTGDGVVVHSCRLQNGKGAIEKQFQFTNSIGNRTRRLYRIEQSSWNADSAMQRGRGVG